MENVLEEKHETFLHGARKPCSTVVQSRFCAAEAVQQTAVRRITPRRRAPGYNACTTAGKKDACNAKPLLLRVF